MGFIKDTQWTFKGGPTFCQRLSGTIKLLAYPCSESNPQLKL